MRWREAEDAELAERTRDSLPGPTADLPPAPLQCWRRGETLTQMDIGILIMTWNLILCEFSGVCFVLFLFFLLVLKRRKEFLSGNNLKVRALAFNDIQGDRDEHAP